MNAAVVRRMMQAQVHRGPDEDGFYSDTSVALGVRRLAIIDEPHGHQPIANEDETLWACCNGEIYNYIELRDTLRQHGHVFRTASDTEVIVHAYEAYGTDFLQHLRGMFALAVWDRSRQRLLLARDRLGQKPLYISTQGRQLAFASELKALLAWPLLDQTLDPKALHDYLSLNYVASPRSLLQQVQKVPPAHIVLADLRSETVTMQRYWHLPSPATDPPTMETAAGHLREVLDEAVRLRLRADKPVGVFLSGGIDSTIVTGLMAKHQQSIFSFSAGFPHTSFDETAFAQQAAETFGTTHTVEQVDGRTVDPAHLEQMVWHMDEPLGDASFVPLYVLARRARQQVKVVLSGDGSDELFAGYPGYRYVQHLSRLRRVPEVFLRGGGWLAARLRKVMPLPGISSHLRQLAKACELGRLDEIDRMVQIGHYWSEAEKTSLYAASWREEVAPHRTDAWMRHLVETETQGSLLNRMMLMDLQTRLADGFLAKVDRASMGCSLEVRSPFLDHQVVEWAMQLPDAYKLHRGMHKRILKQAFASLLPRGLARRGKVGFLVPVAHWFQLPAWRMLLVDMLAEDRLQRQGIFDPTTVVSFRDTLLRDPDARRADLSAHQMRQRLWALLIFQIWYDQFLVA